VEIDKKVRTSMTRKAVSEEVFGDISQKGIFVPKVIPKSEEQGKQYI